MKNVYVATAANGGSDSNTGNIGSPWLTLSYACAHAVSVGDIIHIRAGTYNEANQCVLALGVSIEGAVGAVPIINLTWAGGQDNGAIKMVSVKTNPLANGSHTLSYLDLRGTAGVTGITVEYRNNVIIHDCSISGFGVYGMFFYNGYGTNWWDWPSSLMTGHSVYNCTLTSQMSRFDGCTGFLIYNNDFDNSSLDNKCIDSDHMKGWKIYNNTFTKVFSLTGFNFIFETYRYSDECEIYNNIFNNCGYSLDISDVRPGAGAYGLKIHDNQFLRTSIGQINTDHGCYTLNVEGWGAIQGLYIYNNYFKNCPSGISIGSTNQDYCTYPDGTHWALDHIYMYYNVFENIGATNVQSSIGLWFWEDADTGDGYSLNQVYDNIYICNNVFSTTTDANALPHAWKNYWTQPVTNFHLENNIIQNFTYTAAYMIYSANFTGVSIQKNLMYNNASNTIVYDDGTPSGTINNLTPSDPLFVNALTDFHLQEGSPAIGSGIHITALTITGDYDGTAVGNPPEVGAYEYGTFVAVAPTVTTTAITQITGTTAVSGGNVTSDGGAAVTDRGICWSTSVNPTIGDSHVHNSSGVGIFASSISGLTKNTAYHVRAFATNSVGTSYGTDLLFSTRAFMIVVY